jgi:hypothetical protein
MRNAAAEFCFDSAKSSLLQTEVQQNALLFHFLSFAALKLG